MDWISHIEESLHWANNEVSKLTQDILDIEGVSSNKIKMFLNNLCSIEDITYLELGVFRGSTFCSAIYGNDINSIGIDNWSSPFIKPNNIKHKLNSYQSYKDNNPKEDFLSNVKKYGNIDRISAFNSSYLDFEFSKLENIDIVFYDGEVKYYDQYSVIKNLIPIMKNETVLIVDDWNWNSNKNGIIDAINDFNLTILYQKDIYTSGEDINDFWNGLGIFLLSPPAVKYQM